MAKYIKKVAKNHEEWLSLREGGVGSSEIGTLMGVNKYETIFQLWERKKGLSGPKEETFAMTAGHLLEDAVSQFFELNAGKKVIKASAKEWIAIDCEDKRLRVSPDRLYWINGNGGKQGVLECKTTQSNVDEDSIPPYWFCQLQYQMGVLGLSEGTLAWLKVGKPFEFGYKTFEFNPEFYAQIKETIKDFYDRYIDGEERPTPTTSADVTSIFPVETSGVSVMADNEVADAVDRLKQVKASISELEERKEQLENKIKTAMGEAGILTNGTNDVLVTWKAPEKLTAKFDAKAFQEEHPQMYSQYVSKVRGARRFVVK